MNRVNRYELCRLLDAPLGKKIDQAAVERWSASFWNISRKDRDGGKPFTIMYPPPNITGNLHLGHALTSAVQDALVRQRRMAGMHATWIPGFDHAGLATQSIVENLLWHQQKLTRQQIGRDMFTEKANEWKDLKRSEMKGQLNRLGLALNYEKEYFTLDNNSSHAVQTAFKQLFKSGIIYRARKPVFWSEQLKTTLSDIEVEQIDGVNRYVRTGEVVERRPLPQWFINTDEMASKSVDVVEKHLIKMIPLNYKNSWSSWLVENGVQHWCISRQSWWGHRIPAYKKTFDEDNQESWIVADSLEDAAARLGNSQEVMQDPDVLDTWFSSSLLPLTISGWPHRKKFEESIRLGLFPLDIMETGFDILNYWVSKMVMMSIALEAMIPFKTILLHGMICDSQGKKMSKSKGNVIDPLNVIEGTSLEKLQHSTRDLHSQGIISDNQLDTALENQKKLFPNGLPACGADGLRAYLLSHDIQEEVVRVQINQIDKIRRLSNKIWNVYRFTLLLMSSNENLSLSHKLDVGKLDLTKLDEFDQQVLKQLAKCVEHAQTSFNTTFKLHICFINLEQFWVDQLSSKYIISVKSVFDSTASTQEDRYLKLQLLIHFLVTSTKLLHPFMPHLTEFLYQKLVAGIEKDTTRELSSLSLESYPKLDGKWDTYLS